MSGGKKRKEKKRKEKVQYSVQCLAQPCVSRTAGIWQLISTQSSPLPLVGVLLGLVPIDLGRPNRPEVWHVTMPVVGGSGVAAWGCQVQCGDFDAACFVVPENPEGHCCRQSQQRRYPRHGSVASPTRWRDIGEVAPVAIKLIDFVYGGGCLVGKDEAMRLRSFKSRISAVGEQRQTVLQMLQHDVAGAERSQLRFWSWEIRPRGELYTYGQLRNALSLNLLYTRCSLGLLSRQ
jgi:hypothetical protein